MPVKKLIICTIILSFIFLLNSPLLAIPADPNAVINTTQPDGTILTLKPVGDERNGRLQTLDGYTVLKASDGFYYYAINASDGSIVNSDTKAADELYRTSKEIQFLSSHQTSVQNSNNDRLFPDPILSPELLNQSALKKAVAQDNNVLVILINFFDQNNIYDSSDFDLLMNQPGYDIYGSANDFYMECSYGQFGLTGEITSWYQAENELFAYGYHDGDNWIAAAQLAREAIVWASLDPDIDFSKYDNNGDGNVDGLFVVHAGPGAETGASNYPWSHRWWLSAAGLAPIVTDGVTIDGYTMEPELHSGTEIARIGVFVHEYGHALGLPDLYDTDGGSIGIGSWGVMAGGSWNGGGRSPAHFSAWSKAALGWTTPINITTDTTGILLPDAASDPTVYRVWNEGTGGNQYFLVEYRGKTLFDSFIPGCGVAIWHIDDAIGSNANQLHRKVDLEEGDNSENNSAGDVWINKTFSPFTAPNSDSYIGDSTNVTITVTSTSCEPNGMYVDIAVGIPPSCCTGIRGNIDGDINDEINIADVVYLVEYSFGSPSGPEPVCLEEADVDGTADISIADLVYLVEYSFGTPTGPQPLNCQ